MISFREYLDQLQKLLNEIPETFIQSLVDDLEGCWRDGKRVLLMGNGGSSASASHIVNDLQKCIALESGRALKAACLSDNTPLLMAWANDTDYNNIFTPQVEAWAEPGDVVIGISGSGNSANVLNGIEAANRIGAITYGMCGYKGGKLASIVQKSFVVSSESMQQIEDVHMVVLHIVFVQLRQRLAQ